MPSRASALASPAATAAVLARFGLSPKKHLGQNFLINDAIVQKILRLSEAAPSDDVLEVGPGIGTLTCALASCVRSVVSLERDGDMAAVLAHTMADHPNFQLIPGDALALTPADLEAADGLLRARGVPCGLPSKLVANLPYAVAATLVLRFFEELSFLDSATVMVQREVAQRMQARPGTKEYGAYTVKLSLYARAQGSFAVAAGNFLPAPRVESTVIRLDRAVVADESGEPVGPAVVRAASTMADAAFFARRKTLANSCAAYFRSVGDAQTAQRLPQVFAAAGVDASCRGETLDTARFLAMGRALIG